jgi:hypothetical protein
MTSVFHARRRAEEFAAAVDGGAESSAARGPEVTTLLALVASLRDQPPVEPRSEFATDLRSRLMLEAEATLRPEPATLLLPVRSRGRRERRLVAAASAFVLIGGTTTMAAAAQGALPGDALYPVKRTLERAEAGLSLSQAGKGKDLLSQASDRLTEVQGLVGDESVQSAPRVPATLAAFSSTATEGSTLLFEEYRESGDPASVVAVRTFTSEGIARLEALADTVPGDAQDELAAAAILLHDIDSEAAALCGSCAAELPVVEVPGIFLARADVDRALELAAGQQLDNNHPVVVSKDAFDSARKVADSAGPTPDGPAGPSAPAGPTPLPSPDWNPDAWPQLLPDGDTTGKTAEDTAIAEKLGEDLRSGLDGVVKTLLPDPDGTVG